MKLHPGFILLGALAVALLSLAGVLIYDAMRPAPLRWVAVIVSNSPVTDGLVVVDAETVRRENACNNAVQADMRYGSEVTRLSNPVRTLKADGEARYEVQLPDDIVAGDYSVRLREVFSCSGGPENVESPWIGFEVVK